MAASFMKVDSEVEFIGDQLWNANEKSLTNENTGI